VATLRIDILLVERAIAFDRLDPLACPSPTIVAAIAGIGCTASPKGTTAAKTRFNKASILILPVVVEVQRSVRRHLHELLRHDDRNMTCPGHCRNEIIRCSFFNCALYISQIASRSSRDEHKLRRVSIRKSGAAVP